MVGSADEAIGQHCASKPSNSTGNTLPCRRDEAERFVSALYHGVLRREPDAKGWSRYVSRILSGQTYASVAEEFVASEEFRVQTILANPYVPPGHYFSPIV